MDYFQGLAFKDEGILPHGQSNEALKNQAFLNNVKSFSNKEWWSMPPLLHPNICALYGWKCTRQSCLTCSMCGASLLIRLPPPGSDQYLVEVSRYFELLSTKHESTCSYKESPMPQNLLYMPVIPAEEYLDYVLTEFGVVKREDVSVIFSPKFEDRMEEYDALIDWLIKKAGSNEPTRNDKKLMLLIVSGWRIRRKQKVECDQCFRLLGLWNYFCDTEPESKRLSLNECLALKEEFVQEFSQSQSTERYPALDAERYSDDENGKEEQVKGEAGKEPGSEKAKEQETFDQEKKNDSERKNVEENMDCSDGNEQEKVEESIPESSRKLEVQSGKGHGDEKKKLDPLAEHFPWCRYMFVGFEENPKDTQPSWLLRLQSLNELMIREGMPRRSGGLISVSTLIDSALHPSVQH